MQQSEGRWLLLIHQIPPKPNYFRVKIWRRLQRLGAVPIKNSVYVLPKTEQTQEDFQWLLREINQGKGEGTICDAGFVDGLSNEQVESLFQSAREAEYRQIAEEVRSFTKISSRKSQIGEGRLDTQLARLKRRFADIVARDFFGAPGREAVEGLINGIEDQIQKKSGKAAARRSPARAPDVQAKTWVTRKGIYVDRMASAWLIRRFIDPNARFKFVTPKGYKSLPDEIRFDMFEADFTHEGDHCTFEVLVDRLGLDDSGLTPLAEIVHDIDLKDSKFGRDETAGIERLIAGIAMAHQEDENRLARSSAVFDDLYEYFKRKGG